ncbi:MAG: DUF3006 domain-containing protein [Gemmatimonadetes bacterium]|nr:DUF3006 domain-containing protein [Gemmatimonadota bacterium]
MIVDRVEGDLVVVELEEGRTLDLPRWMLPPELHEGDVIIALVRAVGEEWRVDTRVDAEDTSRRRSAAQEMIQRLRARDPGGDIQL